MIVTSAVFHRVTSEAAYRELVAGKIAALQKSGQTEDFNGDPIEVRDDAEPITAYINHGKWVVDCDCGAGNMVEPAWLIAGCLGCGRIHTNVILPDERPAIEQALAERSRTATKNWIPGETAADLLAETDRMQPSKGRR